MISGGGGGNNLEWKKDLYTVSQQSIKYYMNSQCLENFRFMAKKNNLFTKNERKYKTTQSN